MELNGKIIKNNLKNTYNRYIAGSTPNDNTLSLKEITTELLNSSKRKAQKKDIDDYLNDYVERYNIPDEYKNALRHRGGSLLMAQNSADNDKAQLWGNIKEFADLVSGHDNKIGSAIDAQNNYIGREIYDKYINQNLTNDELMNKAVESIKVYNPNENNYIDLQNKNSRIPARGVFNTINTFTNPINRAYHSIIDFTMQNRMK